MLTVAWLLAAWFLGCLLFVALKVRQPKLEYPKPPEAPAAPTGDREVPDRDRDAA